jgi:hypothetical protein
MTKTVRLAVILAGTAALSVHLAADTLLTTTLLGSRETPPNASPATGTAMVTT